MIFLFLACGSCSNEDIGEVIGISEEKPDPPIENSD